VVAEVASSGVKDAVREIIASIKDIDAASISDEAPLFGDGNVELSLDSLDALDLALSLRERFDPGGDYLGDLLDPDTDLTSLSTVNKIAEYIRSLAPARMPTTQAVTNGTSQDRG
jgi:acyl carrier protein